MITFATLFLGLTLGPQSISLIVSDQVSRVEIVIDGSSVALLDGEPWLLEWDFGQSLLPHELVAIATDRQGHELGQARQWLNLPRNKAEVAIVVEGDSEGQHRSARLIWESLSGKEPRAASITFDDQPLAVTDLSSIPLPPHDPQELHFLRAELEFENNLTSTAEFIFGGPHLGEISSELTAVPVFLEGRRKLPAVAELSGWFMARSGQPEVIAAEKGEAAILVVRSFGSRENLHRIRAEEMSKPLPGAMWRRTALFGSQGWSLKIIWPISRLLVGKSIPFELFAYSEPLPDESGSLVRWLTEMDPPPELEGNERLADAVAVAGVNAAAKSRRRIVVLILGDPETDASSLSPDRVQKYLQALHVPLFVWSTVPSGSPTHGWGPTMDVSSPAQLERAVKLLFGSLDRQRIIWLDGFRLPQDIGLSSRAEGVRIAQ